MGKPKCSINACWKDATRELDRDLRTDEHKWTPYCPVHKPVGPVTGERGLQTDAKEKTTED